MLPWCLHTRHLQRPCILRKESSILQSLLQAHSTQINVNVAYTWRNTSSRSCYKGLFACTSIMIAASLPHERQPPPGPARNTSPHHIHNDKLLVLTHNARIDLNYSLQGRSTNTHLPPKTDFPNQHTSTVTLLPPLPHLDPSLSPVRSLYHT